MQNIYSTLKQVNFFKKLEINELLFVEFQCMIEELKYGIWSDSNYFVFVTSGKKMWRTIHHDYIVEAGQALFVKKGANLAHQFFDEDYCAYFVFIPDDFVKKFMTKFNQQKKTADSPKDTTDGVIRMEVDPFLEGYISSISSFFLSAHDPDRNLLELKFEELLMQVFTRPNHQALAHYFYSLNKGQHYQLEQVMESNYSYNLKLEDYACLCNMSLSSFKRVFKSIYEIAPGKWLSQKRLNRAAHLLKTTDKNINEIAFDCGFEDTSHFIKSFKQIYNNTPLNYRLTELEG